MNRTAAGIKFERIPKDYAELVRETYTLRPIHDAAEYDNVCEIVDVLAVNESRLNHDQSDFLEALIALVEQYDRQQPPVCDPAITGLDALKFLLQENDMSASDLGRLLGHRTLGSSILNGKRRLTIAHIKKLAAHFKVEPGLFL
jgi:HTH-type transcriptional regulator/antitoxin HigA